MPAPSRIVKVTRVHRLPEDGGGTLMFQLHLGGRPTFVGRGEVPAFEGEEAWFEVQKVPATPWPRWKVLRQVESPDARLGWQEAQMFDTRDFHPGDQVVRRAASVAAAGLLQGEVYVVKAFNPRTVDGLELEGVEGRWNSSNFEVVGRPK